MAMFEAFLVARSFYKAVIYYYRRVMHNCLIVVDHVKYVNNTYQQSTSGPA